VAPVLQRNLVTPAGTVTRPSMELSPQLSVHLARMDALRAVRIDGFHSVMWDCIGAASDAANGAEAGSAALAHVVDFLEDMRPPAVLCWGDVRRAHANTFALESSFGPVQIGAPPDALQFALEPGVGAGADVPRIFVFPNNLFTGGVDGGEVNFPAFFNYYIYKSYFTADNRIVLVGSAEQLERIKIVFREAVFGPSEESTYLGEDISLGSYHVNLVAERTALLGDAKADMSLSSYASFQPFDASGVVTLRLRRRVASRRPTDSPSSCISLDPPPAKSGQFEGELRIVNSAGLLHMYEDGQLRGVLDADFSLLQGHSAQFAAPGLPPPPEQFSFQPPAFGITFLGTSHGFDPQGRTTGFIIWVNGGGIVVDPPPDTHLYLSQAGVRGLVTKAIVTHAHTDHDGGLARMLLAGERMTLYTTKTIGESYRRKTMALMGRNIR
jgi:hypothetical protein